jgi:integrase/recombinase XerD
LQGIKSYYNYLIAKDIREDNPAKFLQLKDRKNCQPAVGHRLLSEEDLELLWQYFLNRKNHCKIVKNRDISMTGLLLKQAIRKSEMEALTIEHLDLEKSQICIPQTPKSQARTLALESSQILPFYRYLNEERPRLLQGKPSTNILFISRIGTIEKYGAMWHVIKKSKSLIKNKEINPNTIRMSVIALQFKRGHPLQEVQYFAGHATPTATERYKINHLQALQQSITQHHPLK